MHGPNPTAIATQRRKAFTLVEVMVVVVIIGFLAAAGLPGYRHLTMRSKVTALENDLRQFSTAIQTYSLQNGHWPADGDPQVVPPELASSMPTNFTITPGGRKMENQPDNPMQPEPARLAAAPRCLARTRSGRPCQSPAVRGNRRCRMHGGKGSGAPKGNRNAWKHGARSGETMETLALIRALGKSLGDLA